MYAMIPPSEHDSSQNGDLNRLVNAAVVSKKFCDLLLTDPAVALITGYNGESFHLTDKDRELVLSIRATSLADFALKLTQSRNGGSQQDRSVVYLYDQVDTADSEWSV
jgi:hypothetical protein